MAYNPKITKDGIDSPSVEINHSEALAITTGDIVTSWGDRYPIEKYGDIGAAFNQARQDITDDPVSDATIYLPGGYFKHNTQLVIDGPAPQLEVAGAGVTGTILDYQGQDGEGILLDGASEFFIHDFAVAGNGIGILAFTENAAVRNGRISDILYKNKSGYGLATDQGNSGNDFFNVYIENQYGISGGDDLIHLTTLNHCHVKNVLLAYGSLDGRLLYAKGGGHSTARFESLIATPSVDAPASARAAIELDGIDAISMANIHAVSPTADPSVNCISLHAVTQAYLETFTGGSETGGDNVNFGLSLEGPCKQITLSNIQMEGIPDRDVHADKGVEEVYILSHGPNTVIGGAGINDGVVFSPPDGVYGNYEPLAADATISKQTRLVGVDTSGNAVTVTLPPDDPPCAGRFVWINDEGGNAGANPITVNQNDGTTVTTINSNGAAACVYSLGINNGYTALFENL